MLISSLLGWFVTRMDVKTAFLHASLDESGGYLCETSTSVVPLGFH